MNRSNPRASNNSTNADLPSAKAGGSSRAAAGNERVRQVRLRTSGASVERLAGGAIAIGHPLAATGIRLPVTLARELRRSNLRYGIASACIGGGQGSALLLENPR